MRYSNSFQAPVPVFSIVISTEDRPAVRAAGISNSTSRKTLSASFRVRGVPSRPGGRISSVRR
jgi:hypothetical protein